jgi:type I restriction enzyme R subunit
MLKLCESAVEKMAIEELQSLGFTYIAGVELAPDMLISTSLNEPYTLPERSRRERQSYGDVLLLGRLNAALTKLNPDVP